MSDTSILFIVVEADLRVDEFHWVGVVSNCTMGTFWEDEFGSSLQRKFLIGDERSSSVTMVRHHGAIRHNTVPISCSASKRAENCTPIPLLTKHFVLSMKLLLTLG